MKSVMWLLANVIRLVLVLVLVVLVLVPFYWGLVTSLKPNQDIIRIPAQLVPTTLTLEHYSVVLRGRLFDGFRNSLVSCGGATILGTTVATMAAYALHRFRFPGRRTYVVVLLTTMMITRIALVIPTYYMFAGIGLVDSHLGLMLLYAGYSLPFAVLMVDGSLSSVPWELEDAALIDGCSRLQALYKIIVPLIRPGIAAAALYIFIQSWNDFIVAAIMINTPSKQTVMPTVYNYIGFYGRYWGELTAAAILSLIPLVLFFSALQRQFQSGLSAGAVRG
jgi:ABC-type glycerol-3-phosphate transport system permease component